nr:MAG TPA: hypothetical protein [Caudoviricetes sp.]
MIKNIVRSSKRERSRRKPTAIGWRGKCSKASAGGRCLPT